LRKIFRKIFLEVDLQNFFETTGSKKLFGSNFKNYFSLKKFLMINFFCVKKNFFVD